VLGVFDPCSFNLLVKFTNTAGIRCWKRQMDFAPSGTLPGAFSAKATRIRVIALL